MKKENKNKILNLYDKLKNQNKSIEDIAFEIEDILKIKYTYILKIIERNNNG